MRKNNRDFFSPLHSQLRETLLDAINKGKLKVGQKIPSERELSKIYNVSRTTVRRTIVGLAREHILIRAPGRGTFVSNHLDSGTFVRSKTGNIGFAIFFSPIDRERSDLKEWMSKTERVSERISISIPFYSDVFEGASQELKKYGMHLLFFSGYGDSLPEIAKFREFLKKVDRAIICELISPGSIKFAEKSNFPIVLVSPSIDSSSVKIDSLLIDNIGGAYDAVNYLIELGHKDIGLINHTVWHNHPASERLKGYKLALKKAKFNYDETKAEEGDWSVQSGYLAMKKLFTKKVKVTAIFATNDLMAIGAIKAIKEEGLDVPQDISVVGFDDSEISSHMLPSLTTIRVYRKQMGRYAVQRFMQRIKESNSVPIKVVFPTQLVIRESCSAPSQLQQRGKINAATGYEER